MVDKITCLITKKCDSPKMFPDFDNLLAPRDINIFSNGSTTSVVAPHHPIGDEFQPQPGIDPFPRHDVMELDGLAKEDGEATGDTVFMCVCVCSSWARLIYFLTGAFYVGNEGFDDPYNHSHPI